MKIEIEKIENGYILETPDGRKQHHQSFELVALASASIFDEELYIDNPSASALHHAPT